jgi:Ca2+-binding RTX toxin-like protein
MRLPITVQLTLTDAGRTYVSGGRTLVREVEVRVFAPDKPGDYPVVFWGHGFGASPSGAASTLPRLWADQGYIVVVPTHLDSGDHPNRPTSGLGSLTTLHRVDDMQFLADSFRALEAGLNAVRPGYGFDMSHLVAAGHSQGAFVASLLTGAVSAHPELAGSADPRFKSAVLVSPQGAVGAGSWHGFYYKSPTDHSWTGVTAPTLIITGTDDNGTDGQTFEERLDGFEFAPGGGKHGLVVRGANHVELSSGVDPAVIAEVLGAAVTFSNAYTKGDPLALARLLDTEGYAAGRPLVSEVYARAGGMETGALQGTAGADRLSGVQTADRVFGFAGDDRLLGGGGDDLIDGGSGRDELHGEGGADHLLGGSEADRMFGGDGDDRIGGQDGDDFIDGGNGRDALFGDAGADHMVGGADADRLHGQDGDDLIGGQDGDDFIDGGRGRDLLFGDAGRDHIVGGVEDDRLYGQDGDDLIGGQEGDDFIDGGNGRDVLFGDAGVDHIVGGADGDRLHGQDGDDLIGGQDGDDFIDGGAGRDTLFGDSGDDVMVGGSGADALTGAGGADRFAFLDVSDSAPGASDRIYDFRANEGDVIDLSRIDASREAPGDQAFSFVEAFSSRPGEAVLAFDLGSNTSVLTLDVDGDGVADFRLEIAGNVGAGAGFVL